MRRLYAIHLRHDLTPPMPESLYTAEDLVISPGKHASLPGTQSTMNFAIPLHSFTAIVGCNGAGKSTLLKTLAGLMAPAAGSLTFHHRPLKGLFPAQRCTEISWCPPDHSLPFNLSVVDFIALGLYPHHLRAPKVSELQKVRDLLASFSLQHLAGKHLFALSSGEQKKVSILRTLIQNTSTLLFDEPTAHLDLTAQKDLMISLQNLTKQGKTVICAMHNITLVHRYCDYILVLQDLLCLHSGRTSELFNAEQVDLGLGVPMALTHCQHHHPYYLPQLYDHACRTAPALEHSP